MGTQLTAILVDDEPDSLITIEEQLKMYCPEVNVIGTYNDSLEGLENILALQPDVAFLDVQMPKFNGLDLAKKVTSKGINVVFITAHQKYALDAFDLSAIDYLLKPFQGGDKLKRAVSKIKKEIALERQLPIYDQLMENERSGTYSQETEIALTDDKGVYYYKINEIIRLEADRNTCTFYFTNNRKRLVTKNMGTFYKVLKSYDLVKVNRSEVVNLEHRKGMIRNGPYLVMTDDTKVLVSPNYKKDLPFFQKSSDNFFTRLFKKTT